VLSEYYKQITISSDLEGLKECLELTWDVQRKIDLDSDKSFALQTVLLEAVNNAITHGNKHNRDLRAVITIKVNEEEIFIEVEDEGDGFDLDKIPSPIENDNICLENGRGIFFIRKLSNSFNTVGKGNIVNIIIQR
jgi:serine/threonine-protein kinase RsbW